MTPADILLIAALAAFVVVWWTHGPCQLRPILWAAAIIAFAAGIWGTLDDRWQAAAGAIVALVCLAALAITARRQGPRRRLPFISGSLLGLLAIIAAAAIWLFPVGALPAPGGPYAVGVRTFELSDASRPGVLAAKADEPRRLLVRVWYPAEKPQGRPARYFSETEADTTAHGLGSLLGFGQFLSYLKHVTTNAFDGAPLLAGASSLPTILYSHGYTSFAGQNEALMETLASHGYAVYAIQHTYDSSAAVFPDGTVVPMDPALTLPATGDSDAAASMQTIVAGTNFDERLEAHIRYQEALLKAQARIVTKSAPVWVADIAFVLDRLQVGDVPEAVAGIVAAGDLTRIGDLGMSFGGSTAGGFCAVDRRCAAGVNMDGLNFHTAALGAGMPVPFMMLHGDLKRFHQFVTGKPTDASHSFNEFSYEALGNSGATPGVYRFEVRGAMHMGFSDFSLFMRSPLSDMIVGSTPPDIMIALQNDVVRGFFDRHLRGLDNGFPDRQQADYRDWLIPLDNAPLRDWWLAKPEPDRAALEARIEALRRPR